MVKKEQERTPGLLSREEIYQHMDEVFASIHREDNKDSKRRITLACIDLDNFSNFNKNYGYAFGNHILTEVGRMVLDNLEGRGIAARYGGDEFLVFFDNISFEETFIMLENLRREIKSKPLAMIGEQGEIKAEITSSIGIASYPANGKDLQELIRSADEALYRAKKEGRDRIYLAIEEKKVPKTVYYTRRQVERVTEIAQRTGKLEADLFREAVDMLLERYDEK